MQVVARKRLRLVSPDKAVIRWLDPGKPVELPRELALEALRMGAELVIERSSAADIGPPPPPPKPPTRAQITKQALRHLEKLFDVNELTNEAFGADGSPRMSLFSGIPGVTPAIRDDAWRRFTIRNKGVTS